MGKVVELTDNTFETEVLKSEIPVAVDFWASWCGPCRMLAPIMEEVAGEVEGKVKVCKLNVDESPSTASKYGIQSIPTVLIFKGGEMVDQFTGARPKQAVLQFLDSIG